VTAVAENGPRTETARASFSTLTAQGRLLTAASPQNGDVVGVGEPIDLTFNRSIPDSLKAALIERLHVSSTPGVMGAWHWFSGDSVHFRPETYWPSGTKVTLSAQLKGYDAGGGVWGQGDWSMTFTVGDKHVSIIDDTTHQMMVYDNDKLIDTWPVSLGKAGFPTLSGTLVVLYKLHQVMMDSCGTFGGAACIPGSTNYYHEYVYYDTAISTNGFYIHAAPWSVYAQGHYDVSHGCVNLSTERAIQFFDYSVPGDVVVILHTPNIADITNGEADWQTPFAQFANTPGMSSPVYTGATRALPPGFTLS
jgi:lipoprotein-anchoring transpeptidase ErfK/SrfK